MNVVSNVFLLILKVFSHQAKKLWMFVPFSKNLHNKQKEHYAGAK
jgi:hypothetical protein